MMQLSPAVLSAPARTAVAAMVKTGQPAVVQYERGERKAYYRTTGGREKPMDPMAVDELVKAGIVADRQDGLFAGIGQTYEPRQHAVLKIRLGGTRTDKATGARFRKAEVETTAGAFQCEVCARQSKDADPLDGDSIKAEVRRLIAEKRPMLGGEQ
ncbi:hypothetical protein [Azospirillum himalayense]|uniref:Uncharacterized protein n=1 Tax=Azospirillum himalayense TaxID=654847 RepID=A0ABW0FZ60_9PROT